MTDLKSQLDKAAAGQALGVKRVQSSYVQVADQLRDLIVRGDISVGAKLPSEAELAPLFGVSRSTIREALRILSTENLIETRRGVQGGAFVAEPDAGRVEGMLNMSLSMLALTNQVDAGDFLEAMRALEGPAARLAAERRGAGYEDELRRTSRPRPGADRESLQRDYADFHSAVLRASGNKLLEAMGRPVAVVARARFRQTTPSESFWEENSKAHLQIAHAILSGDADAAYQLASTHIDELSSHYHLD
jgi:GntR family transcriptional regulator, transcriptional repressor for pyruvate dehydrogenase complex